jgi:hypothetical protein
MNGLTRSALLTGALLGLLETPLALAQATGGASVATTTSRDARTESGVAVHLSPDGT